MPPALPTRLASGEATTSPNGDPVKLDIFFPRCGSALRGRCRPAGLSPGQRSLLVSLSPCSLSNHMPHGNTHDRDASFASVTTSRSSFHAGSVPLPSCHTETRVGIPKSATRHLPVTSHLYPTVFASKIPWKCQHKRSRNLGVKGQGKRQEGSPKLVCCTPSEQRRFHHSILAQLDTVRGSQCSVDAEEYLQSKFTKQCHSETSTGWRTVNKK